MTDLGTLGGTTAMPMASTTAGRSWARPTPAGDAAHHAFLYSGGTMTDLGTLGGTNSEAQGINASGQVVGSSYTANNADCHAFLYSDGTMADLNTLLEPGADWTVREALAINESGQIAAFGYDSGGHARALLLTPQSIPEPSTIALLGVLGIVVGWWRRRKVV